MSETPSRGARWLTLPPVLAALGLNAVAHERWLLSAPLAVALVAATLARFTLRRHPLVLVATAAVGAGVGLLLLAVSTPPLGPIPPPVLSPLCGAVALLATTSALSGTRMYAWTYACVLAVLSLHGRPTPVLLAALALMAMSLLACTYLGSLGRAGLAGVLGFGAFTLTVAGTTWGLSRSLYAGEGMLVGAVYELLKEVGLPTGLGLQPMVGLEPRSRMANSSRPLLELEGPAPQRLRTVVLEQFDGQRWTATPEPPGPRPRLPAKAPEPAPTLELHFRERLGPYLPAPAGTQAVEGAQVEVLGGGVLRALGEGPLTYARLHVQPAELLPQGPAPGPELLALPPALREELRPLAESLLGAASSHRAKAEALEAFFQNHFEYSLLADLSGEGSPLAVLVRERRAAYCVYFASAMAALLRTQGVPARMVGGFVPAERNPLSGTVVVRERDAHAWVEVYLEEEGRYVAFDPTPWRSREEELGLDEPPGLASAAVQALGTWLRRAVAAVRRDPAAAAWAVVRSPATWLVLAALAVWRWRRWRPQALSRGPRAALESEDERLATSYKRYLRTLRRHAGLVPSASETDDELLARLRATHGERAALPAEAFLAEYRRLRYRSAPAAAVELQEHLSRLESALRSSR